MKPSEMRSGSVVMMPRMATSRVPTLMRVTELYAEPSQEQGIGGHTIDAVLQGDCVLKRAVVFENDLAVKRIDSICCLDFNQGCCVGCYGHGAECRHLADRAVAGNEVQFRCGLLRGG